MSDKSKYRNSPDFQDVESIEAYGIQVAEHNKCARMAEHWHIGGIMDKLLWEFDIELQLRRERLNTTGYDAYCVFCAAGREINAATEINRANEDFIALPFMRVMHKSKDGVKTLTQDILLKGYLFLFAPKGADVFKIENTKDVFNILGRNDNEGKLLASDLRYAEWALSLGGVIGVSKAIKIGGRVKIIDGPLISLEGSIKEYSKRNRNCRVSIDIVEQQLSVWLPFEWVEIEDGVIGAFEEGDDVGNA